MDQHQNFTPFRRLPLELRLRIWSDAILAPRIIELEHQPHRGVQVWHTPTIGGRSAPPILHVCSESRALALKIYTHTSFGAWMNWDLDTIYLLSPSSLATGIPPSPHLDTTPEAAFLQFLSTRSLLPLRHLAIWNFSWFKYEVREQTHLVPKSLPNLKELVIVMEDKGFESSKMKWKRGMQVGFEDVAARRRRMHRVLGREEEPLFRGEESVPVVRWVDVKRVLPEREAGLDQEDDIKVKEVRESWENALTRRGRQEWCPLEIEERVREFLVEMEMEARRT